MGLTLHLLCLYFSSFQERSNTTQTRSDMIHKQKHIFLQSQASDVHMHYALKSHTNVTIKFVALVLELFVFIVFQMMIIYCVDITT